MSAIKNLTDAIEKAKQEQSVDSSVSHSNSPPGMKAELDHEAPSHTEPPHSSAESLESSNPD